MPNSEIDIVLAFIDQGFDHKSWHGTNLKGSIMSLSPEIAIWRPAPDRHNIWEIVVHAAYWKYVVRRRLTGEKRGSFPMKGSNWFARAAVPGADDKALRTDVILLRETHKSLRTAVAAMSPSDLHNTPTGGKTSNMTLITGIAAHDFYHAGQIQLLKRLAGQSVSKDQIKP